ncbi:protein FAR1-RELATED SEQUENCE 5-like [Asparagus officinalis]|uniref:protein FAR1-RELATED SEQUENCE 5-like n=1 Tax=Asparagus officinalis TaxID=4686 RepID=UPI00098E52EA|nr:protein FAR1-RELATED SEQUENCE 5-like [Asparagus officinalis]
MDTVQGCLMARLVEYVDSDLIHANEEIEKTTQESQSHEDEYLEENLSHIPCIDEPKIGMMFKSLEEAMNYYSAYALFIGFGIRKGSNYMSKRKNVITMQLFTCSHEGYSKSKRKESLIRDSTFEKSPSKEISSIRTGCKASMRMKLDDEENWIISSFEKKHNHELVPSPSKSRFYQCRRKIRVEEADLIRIMREQNISTKHIRDFIASQRGGVRNLSFTRRDLSNFATRQRMSLFNSDISTTLSYFQQLQAENPMFFYAVQIDSNNCAKNMFWVDGRSRMAYQHFGDAVTFDTTYCTNKYSMPFAPFIGVNHHSQTILLGCALIRDETAESFMWVFRTWLNAMFGKHPTCILTDQDPSMRKAISEVLPNTALWFCKWHILRKAREHLGILFGTKEKFQEDFLSCINFSLTVEDLSQVGLL